MPAGRRGSESISAKKSVWAGGETAAPPADGDAAFIAFSDLEILSKSAAMSANAPRAADGTFAKTSPCESASTSPKPRFFATSAALKNIFAAVFSPTFGRNRANRINETESLGFAANFN